MHNFNYAIGFEYPVENFKSITAYNLRPNAGNIGGARRLRMAKDEFYPCIDRRENAKCRLRTSKKEVVMNGL